MNDPATGQRLAAWQAQLRLALTAIGGGDRAARARAKTELTVIVPALAEALADVMLGPVDEGRPAGAD